MLQCAGGVVCQADCCSSRTISLWAWAPTVSVAGLLLTLYIIRVVAEILPPSTACIAPGKGEGTFVCSILSVPTVNFTTDRFTIRLIDWMVFRLQKQSLVCDYIYGRFNVFKRLKVTIFSSQRLSTRQTPSCVQEDLFAANGESWYMIIERNTSVWPALRWIHQFDETSWHWTKHIQWNSSSSSSVEDIRKAEYLSWMHVASE